MKQNQVKKVQKAVFEALKSNNTITTLEIKTKLRMQYPTEKWYQLEISKVMDDMQQDGKLTYTDNGIFRVYSGIVKKQVKISSLNTNKNNTLKNKSISKTKAFELIENNSNKIFSVVFTKKDNTERKMVCRYKGGGKWGYLSVIDMSAAKKGEKAHRQVNLQTLSELKIGGVKYTVK